jgi:tRNA (guanine9-N1)-methyltransferase
MKEAVDSGVLSAPSLEEGDDALQGQKECTTSSSQSPAAQHDGAGKSLTGLSKKALKREQRQEQYVQVKKQKKLAEKERRKQRRAIAAATSSSSSGDGEKIERAPRGEEELRELSRQREEEKRKKRDEYLSKSDSNFSIIIDCAWDAHLVDRSLKSLSQQILFCYGANRKVTNPCKLFITGLNQRVRDQLEKSSLSNWLGVVSDSRDYIDLPEFEGGKKLVYLTSDAEETIETLDVNTAYIIGGIVDRNRLKGATFNKATSQGIRTVKLPIKEHLKLSSTHVLTVNHVFEILLSFQRSGSWAEAIATTIPQRKGATLKTGDQDQDQDQRHAEWKDSSD